MNSKPLSGEWEFHVSQAAARWAHVSSTWMIGEAHNEWLSCKIPPSLVDHWMMLLGRDESSHTLLHCVDWRMWGTFEQMCAFSLVSSHFCQTIYSAGGKLWFIWRGGGGCTSVWSALVEVSEGLDGHERKFMLLTSPDCEYESLFRHAVLAEWRSTGNQLGRLCLSPLDLLKPHLFTLWATQRPGSIFKD